MALVPVPQPLDKIFRVIDLGRHTSAGVSTGPGEPNDGANVGTAGVGPYDGKSGVTLNFRNLNDAGSGRISVALDAGNKEIDLDVVEASLSINSIGGSPLTIANGGTGQTSQTPAFDALSPLTTQGDVLYHDGTNNVRLGANATATNMFLRSVSSGDPSWAQVGHADLSGIGTDDHHAKVHALIDATNHPESGLTAGHVVRASGATSYAFAQLQHSDLGGVGTNDHHAQSHVLATNTALGPDHTISGASAGDVLRASSATAANFQALAHSDLSGVTANDHHAQSHVLATTAGLGADHTTSGLSVGQVLRATGATTAAFASIQASDLPSIDHGSGLTGLSDDDHTQYALLAGRSGGQILYGGTTAADSLQLGANSAAFAAANSGRIRLKERMQWTDSWTMTWGQNVFLIADTRSFTLPVLTGFTAGSVVGFIFNPSVSYGGSMIFTVAPAFWAQPLYKPTFSGADAAFNEGFRSEPSIWNQNSSGTYTGTAVRGFASYPSVYDNVAGSATVPEVTWYYAGNVVNGAASPNGVNFDGPITVTNARGFYMTNPSVRGGPTVTTLTAIDILNLTRGTTNLSLRSAGTSVEMRHAGPGVFGANAAPTNSFVALEVQSTTKAFLLPRMTTTQRNAISSPLNGMMIYNTTTGVVEAYEGGTWVNV